MAMAFGAVSSGWMVFNEAVPRKLGFPPKMVLMFALEADRGGTGGFAACWLKHLSEAFR